jgi:hypothetical protein
MTRLVFIGSSHLVAYRQAWTDQAGRWPGVTADFLGAHGDLTLQTVVRDGRLTADTDKARQSMDKVNGHCAVDIGGVDAIVICGCLVSSATPVNLWRQVRWTGLPSLARSTDLASMAPTLMSETASRAMLAAMVEQRLGLRLIRHLRTLIDRPILLAAQPHVSAAVRRTRPPDAAPRLRAVAMGDGPALSTLFADVTRQSCRAAGAVWVSQDPATIVAHLFTAERFMRGARRLGLQALPQARDDMLHGNAAYGAAMIDRVIGALAGQE